LLDLACRGSGDFTTSEKWLASRVRRAGLPTQSWAEVDAEAGFRRLATRLGLPSVDEWAVTRLKPAAGAESVKLAGRAALLTRSGRLLYDPCTVDEPLTTAAERFGAATLLRAVRRAELDLIPDGDLIREALAR
jgi:hypothetical protein